MPLITSGRCRHILPHLRPQERQPVVVPLNEPQDRVAKLLAGVQGILLPGSGFDVDPERYGEKRIPECSPADAARTAVDELMLQDAFNLRKPILAICHGAQTLNVWRNGSLIQDLKTTVNHRPGREVAEAHPVKVTPGSRLSGLLPVGDQLEVQVNSSHHQAVRVPGDRLLVTAISPLDEVVEALERLRWIRIPAGIFADPSRASEPRPVIEQPPAPGFPDALFDYR